MFWLTCPYCGERPMTEFTYGGDALRKMPELDADAASWQKYVYQRTDPKGIHIEYWHHVKGCRNWITVVRDTVTHEVHECGEGGSHLELARKYGVIDKSEA